MTWDWQVFCQDNISQETVSGCFGSGGDVTYLDWMLSAWGWTVSVSVLSLLLAVTVGAFIGTIRTFKKYPWAIHFGNVWVEFFRNIPLLVHIFLWYHVVPTFIPSMQHLPGFVLVVFALGFFTSARVAEQVTSGIKSIPSGQYNAARALGCTDAQCYIYVLLPQAFRIILPPLTSEAMGIFKNSSVAFAVSVAELTMFAMQAQEETARGVEIYLGVTLLYIISAFSINLIMRAIEKYTQIPGFAAGGNRA